jgi:hypothetical protein
MIPTLQDMEVEIDNVCQELSYFLKGKQKAYGNSVPDPLCVFSKADAMERIGVRLDDKLSRLARGNNAGEDVELDIIGYLILKRAILKFNKKNSLEV